MADEAELDIGIKFDEEQFTSAYNRFLSKLSQSTSTFIQAAMDDMKGAAAKSWSTLPFNQMHTSTGNRYATAAFLPSFAEDLKKMGLSQSSEAYNSALMSATYRSSIADVAQRRNFLQAQGMNTLSPDSVYERVLNTDYTLMSQPWARYFLKTHRHKGIDEEELRKLKVSELKSKAAAMGLNLGSRALKADYISAIAEASQKATATFDFAGMREEAVEKGIGRWIDPKKEHTAENFELIDKSLKDINTKAAESKKHFNGWGHELKGALGTLTAIVSTVGKIGATALGAAAVAYKASESYTVNRAAVALDNRRAFLDMSPQQVIETIVAGKGVGLGEQSIFSEIEKLSSNREEYKLLGKGLDALYPSLQGTFGTIMGTENPYTAYRELLTTLYKQLEKAGPKERQRALMLLNKQGLTSAEQILGYSLNHKIAPDELFTPLPNRYAGSSYEAAELLTPQIAKLNESLKQSYSQMAKDWETAFGVPFKKWWDNALKDKIVPWFDRITEYWAPEAKERRKELRPLYDAVVKQIETRNAHIEGRSSELHQVDWYTAPKNPLPSSRLQNWFGKIPAVNPDDKLKANSAKAEEAYWNTFEKFAKYTDKDLGGDKDLIAYRDRAAKIVKMINDTALTSFFTNNKTERTTLDLMRAMQMGIYDETVSVNGQDVSGMQLFQAYIDKILEVGSKSYGPNDGTDKIIEALNKIADNTKDVKMLLDDPAMQLLLSTYGGTKYYQQARADIINRQP